MHARKYFQIVTCLKCVCTDDHLHNRLTSFSSSHGLHWFEYLRLMNEVQDSSILDKQVNSQTKILKQVVLMTLRNLIIRKRRMHMTGDHISFWVCKESMGCILQTYLVCIFCWFLHSHSVSKLISVVYPSSNKMTRFFLIEMNATNVYRKIYTYQNQKILF